VTAVRIPPVLRAQAGGQKQVEVTGATVGEAIEALLRKFPGLRQQLIAEDGGLNRFVIVYLNDEDIRYLKELATPLDGRDTIVILPAMAGGDATVAGGPG